MITNAGYVALKYYQPQTRVLVPANTTPTQTNYVFLCKANITMAWVKPGDVNNLLSRRKNCCGSHKKQSFYYANEDDVRRWSNGGGR
jgi:hypothetical protein